MKTFVNNYPRLRNAFFCTLLVLLGGGAATVNMCAPTKPELLLPTLPSRHLIGCFIGGEIVFSGETLGDVHVDENGTITFFSTNANTTIRIINGSCITTELKSHYHSIDHQKKREVSPEENGLAI